MHHKTVWIGLLVMILLVGCAPRVTQLPIPNEQGQAAMITEGAAAQPMLAEDRKLIIEWPEHLRVGESDFLLLSIAVDENGQVTASTQPSGSSDAGMPVDIPNLYETHNVMAAARLEISGMQVAQEEIREPLRPGKPATFRWNIRAGEAGKYRGVLWLHLEFVPKHGGDIERMTLLARPVEIEAVSILGMPVYLARGLAGLGLLAGAGLGFPFVKQGRNKASQNRQQPVPEPLSRGS